MDVAVSAFGAAYKRTAGQALGQPVNLKGSATVGGVEVTFETVVPARGGDTDAPPVKVDVPAPPAADVFASRLREIANANAASIGIAIGVRTGLFDAMAAAEHPVSVAELSHVTRLEDRYIEEWLSLMVTAGIVQASTKGGGGGGVSTNTSTSTRSGDTGAGAGAGGAGGGAGGAGAGAGAGAGSPAPHPVARFMLPPGATALLASGAGGMPSKLARRCHQMQLLVVEGFNHMQECFTQGGGVPAMMFPLSGRIAAELKADTPVDQLVAQVPQLHDRLAAPRPAPSPPSTTAGTESAPPAPAAPTSSATPPAAEGASSAGAPPAPPTPAPAHPPPSARVLVADDRTGAFACALGKAYPHAEIVGWGQTPEEVDAGKAASAKAGVTNVIYTAASLDWEVDEDNQGAFTHVIVLHGFSASNDPTYAVENVYAALAPGGTATILQLSAGRTAADNAAIQPLAPVEYATSLMYALPLSRSGDAAGVGLLWDAADAEACLREPGFAVHKHTASWDTRLSHFVCTKPGEA